LLAGFCARLLVHPLAPHNDGGAVEDDVNLQGTAQVITVDDLATKLVDVLGCGGMRVRTAQVDMVEHDVGIMHSDFSSAATLLGHRYQGSVMNASCIPPALLARLWPPGGQSCQTPR
jgi:hypothetical protein